MRYDDKYEKTEERMCDVIDTVQELTKDRFIASLYVRNVTSIDVDIRLAEVRRCLDIVHGEMLRLSKLELTYNSDFAVDDNQRFTTAERLFNRLRGSMAYIRKSFRRSCPIIRKRPRNPNLKPSVFERSVLTKGDCARDLFDITTYGDNVQALYYEQQALFANVIISLAICYRVIKEERETKENPERCVRLLDEQCERILKDLEGVIDNMKDIPECEIQQLIDQMGKPTYAQEYYHKPTVEKLTEYAIYVARHRTKEKQLTQDESRIFKSAERAADALVVVAHIDEVMPSNRKMMLALKIRLFCNWCNGGSVDNPKETFYHFLLRHYVGKHEKFPDWHAVTASKSRGDMDALQKNFNEEIDELLKKYKNADEKNAS